MSEDELPEGWAVMTLADAVDQNAPIQYGILQPGPDTPGGIPYVRPTEIRGDEIDVRALRRTTPAISARYVRSSLKAGDVILTIVGSIGKVAVVPMALSGANITQSSARLRPREGLITTRYLAWLVRSPAAHRQFDEVELGTGVPRLNIGDIRKMEIPLAPLAEQGRIVEKVEALLAQVNAARARLAKVPAILKRFRQSILSAACSGRLTEGWRAANFNSALTAVLLASVHGLSHAPTTDDNEPLPEQDVPDEWPVLRLGLLTEKITSGSRAWSRYYRADAPATFVMAQNVRALRFDRSTRQGVAPPANDPERERTRVMKDDILVTIVGANTGDVCRVPSAVEDHYVCQSVALVRPAQPEMAAFLELFLNSASHGRGQYLELLYGEGRPHLSLDHLRNTAVGLPPLREQREIVRRVDALFKLADVIEARVTDATGRADSLTQAILAKAFRGDLVPTEAELARREGRPYEPASVLLARIRAEQAAAGHGGRRARVRRPTAVIRKAPVS